MRFDLTDLDGTRWLEYRAGDEVLQVELRRLTAERNLDIASKINFAKGGGTDWDAMLRLLSEEVFVGFKGAETASGEALENTPEIRHLMLRADPEFSTFVINSMRGWSSKESEGNEGRASG